MIRVKQIISSTVIAASLVYALYPSVLFAAEKGKKILYWAAPMDPSYRGTKPGKSPMGMEQPSSTKVANENKDSSTDS